MSLSKSSYNPDVLECLANLSNDEVFTPPKIVNNMLDVLPKEVWSNPNLKFLDPACKTGVFLREIAKRLIDGLESQIPDLQQRIDHIFQNQLYGIAITELTALASRRSLYCSKYANGKYSVSKFSNPDGNIRFVSTNHVWQNGRCKYCGANQAQYARGSDRETHAYEFIHTNNPEEIFGMKFDVIVGNPPYQLTTNNDSKQAIPIYDKFVRNCIQLTPKLFSFIIPSRWMTGGMGLDSFRSEMISRTDIKELHDFPNCRDCFPNNDIKGGVCYFLIEKGYSDKCKVVTHSANKITESMRSLSDNKGFFIRNNILVNIYNRVLAQSNKYVSEIVSSIGCYGLGSDAFKNTEKYGISKIEDKPFKDCIRVRGLIDGHKRSEKYISMNNFIPTVSYDKYKLFVPEAYGCGAIGEVPSTPVLGTPVLGTPGEACTATFVEIGPFDTEEELGNFYSYLKTKFFRALVGVLKNTQHASAKVYSCVPLQDFSKSWTDEELYKKYGLTQEEIDFIEENIQPMEDR